MNKSTQLINAYLNGELEECEVINFHSEIQSNESLELAVSYEMLKVMEAERLFRITELSEINGSFIENNAGNIAKPKNQNLASYFLQIFQKST